MRTNCEFLMPCAAARSQRSLTVICKALTKMPEAIIQHHLHLTGVQIIARVGGGTVGISSAALAKLRKRAGNKSGINMFFSFIGFGEFDFAQR